MTRKYILNGHRPVLEPDLLTWAAWYEVHTHRMVAWTHTTSGDVSTVFLSIEPLRVDADSLPLLFETLVFGGPWDGTTRRVATWEEAEQTHKAMVALLETPGTPA